MTSYYYAVKALLDNNIHSLPITADVLEEILSKRGWSFIPFDLQNEDSIKELTELNVIEYAHKFKCFSYKKYGYKIVFYERDLSATEKTFGFAHELGHDYVGHYSDTGILGHHSDMSLDIPQENEANEFARYFLAPPRILKKLHIKNTEDVKRYTLLNSDLAKVQVTECKETKGEPTNEESCLLLNFNSYIDSQTIRRRMKRWTAGIIVTAVAVCIAACVFTFNFATRQSTVNNGPVHTSSTTIQSKTTPAPAAIPIIKGNSISIRGTEYSLNTPVYRVKSKTEVFHKADCSYVVGKDNLTEMTIQTATDSGLRACTRCFK